MAAILVFVFAADVAGAEQRSLSLSACGDENEFPPYSYFVRRDGVRSQELAGYSVDYVAALARLSGRPIRLTLLPWARCLRLAELGQIDFVIDTANNQERGERFLFAGPYYAMSGVGFLYRKDYRQPLPRSAEEFSHQHICIPLGYTFQRLGDRGGANVERPETYAQAYKMLRAGRCDFVPVVGPVLAAVSKLGEVDPRQDGDIVFQRAAWVTPVDMYFSVGKRAPQRDAVVRFLTDGIRQMKQSGEAARLAKANGMTE